MRRSGAVNRSPSSFTWTDIVPPSPKTQQLRVPSGPQEQLNNISSFRKQLELRMSSLQEEQKLDRNHLQHGDERDEMEGRVQCGIEDRNGLRSSLESDDSRRVATSSQTSDLGGGGGAAHLESSRPPLVARRCSANFDDTLLPTSPRKSAHQRRIERSSMAQQSPDRRDEHHNISRPPFPREPRAAMKAFSPPLMVDEEQPFTYKPKAGIDREDQREGMENTGGARTHVEEVPAASNASNVTKGRRIHYVSSTHRVMKSDGVTSVSGLSGTDYNSEPSMFSELHMEKRTYTVQERISQDYATAKMDITESMKEPKDNNQVGDTAETVSTAMSDSKKKSKKSKRKKKKNRDKSDGSSKEKRSEKKKKRSKSKKNKKEKPSPEKVWFGSRKQNEGDMAGRHNECLSVNNGESDLSSMTDTAHSQATPGTKKSRRADISTIRVPIVLEKPDDDVSFATDPSNNVQRDTAMKVQNDNGNDVVFLSEESLATSRAAAAATAAASLLITEEEGSYDTAAHTVSSILSRSSRLKEDPDKDGKRISEMEGIEEESKLALVVIPSAGYSTSMAIAGEASEVETQHREANGASGPREEEEECKQTPFEKVMEGIEEENKLALVAIPSGGHSSTKSVKSGKSNEMETQQQETNMPINPLHEKGRKPIPFVKVQNAMRDYLIEQKEAAAEKNDGDDAIGTATHRSTPTEIETFWAKCAILAASAVLKSNGGTVQIAQVAAETILVACSKDTNISTGDTTRITDIAAQTSLSILSAGGSEAAASAAAIAVLNEEKNRIQHDLDCRSEEPDEPFSPTEMIMNNDVSSVASHQLDRTTSNEQLLPDSKSSHIQDSPVLSEKSVENEEGTNKRSVSMTSNERNKSTMSHDQDSLDEFLKQNAETDGSTHRSDASLTKQSARENAINAPEIQSGSVADSNPNACVAVKADPYEAEVQMSEEKVPKKLTDASSVSHHGRTPRTSNAPQVIMKANPSLSKKEIVEEDKFSNSAKIICEDPGAIAAVESESAKAREVLDETMCQNSRTKSIGEEPGVNVAVVIESAKAREVLDESMRQNSRTKSIVEEPGVIVAVESESPEAGEVLGETKSQKTATKSLSEEPEVIAAVENESPKAVSIVEVNLPNTSATGGVVMAADSSLTLTKDDDLTIERSEEMDVDLPMKPKDRESGKLGWLQALEKRKAEIKAEQLSRNTGGTLERDLLVQKIRRIKCRAAKIPYEGEEVRNNADLIGQPGLKSRNTGDIYGVIECDKDERTIEVVSAIKQENRRVEYQLEKDPIGASSDISASATNENSQPNKGDEGEEKKSESLESVGVVLTHSPDPSNQESAILNDFTSSIKIPNEDTEVTATRFYANEPELSEEVEVFLEEDIFQEKDSSSDMYASSAQTSVKEEEEEASREKDWSSKMEVSAQSGFKEEEEVLREGDSSSEEEEASRKEHSSSELDMSAQQSAKGGEEDETFSEEDNSSKLNESEQGPVKEAEVQSGLETQNLPHPCDEFLENKPDLPEGEKGKKRRKSVFKRASHSFKKLVGKKAVQEREYTA